MIALLATAVLLAQDPQAPVSTQEPPVRSAGDFLTYGMKAAPSSRQTSPPEPRPTSCLSRSYADANPDACVGPGAEEAEPAAAQEAAPRPPPVQPLKRPAADNSGRPPIAVPKAPDEHPSIFVLTALGIGIAVMLAAVVVTAVRLRKGGSSAGVREVELAGPERVVLSPTDLARRSVGPGKSRWSIRDGRLIVNGPEGSLLNGVPLDRSGDVVSTGDTVRLGGADYRVRII